MSQTILIVEDEMRLAQILREYVLREGFRCEVAADGQRGLELWRAASPDLILLDLMLPKIDGLEVARRIRAESLVPIIMLTARDEEVDKLVGLGLGADDYVVKPYSPREVVARIKAVLRRTASGFSSSHFVVGKLEVNLDSYITRCSGAEVSLTTSEIRVLAHLMKAPETVRSRLELLMIMDEGSLADERTIDVHIRNLRRKLGACGEQIETVRGVGYRVRAQ